MDTNMKTIIVIFLLFASTTKAQTGKNQFNLEVGKPCPNFVLHNIEYFPKTQASLKDFKGKWLVLDFWNRYCASCVNSFPKTNDMQKEFYNNVQFIYVGYNGSLTIEKKPDDRAI